MSMEPELSDVASEMSEIADTSELSPEFLAFMENVETREMPESLSLSEYGAIYDDMKRYNLPKHILKKLERYYQGTQDIYHITDSGWDAYLPETTRVYTLVNTLPKNLAVVKTDYRLKLVVTHMKSVMKWLDNRENEEYIEYVEELELFDQTKSNFDLSAFFNRFINLKRLKIHTKIDCLDVSCLSKLAYLDIYDIDVNLIDLSNSHNLTFLKIRKSKNIEKILLNEFLKTLILLDGFNGEIDLTNLYFLEYLELGNDFNQKVILETLSSLRVLKLGHKFDQELHLFYQKNLTTLEIGNRFDHEFDVSACLNLKRLKFGKFFDQKIDLKNLANLTYLEFGTAFFKELNLKNQTKLKYLIFGDDYNLELDLSSCKELVHLKFGLEYDQILNLNELTKLKFLYIDCFYEHSLDLSCLTELEHLAIISSKIELNDNPNSDIVCFKHQNKLKTLNISVMNKKLDLSNQKECLEKLTLNRMSQSVDLSILTNLKILVLDWIYDQKIDLTQQTSLVSLIISKYSKFDHPINFENLTNLVYVFFGGIYNQKTCLLSCTKIRNAIIANPKFTKTIIMPVRD
jgi:hypothetical protein